MKKLTLASEPNDTTFGPGLGRLLAQWFKPFAFLDSMERMNKTIELKLCLPTCDDCASIVRTINPDSIDFDSHQVDPVVHTAFKQALEQSD